MRNSWPGRQSTARRGDGFTGLDPSFIVRPEGDRATRPAVEWTPRYDIAEPTAPKARGIRAALDAVSRTLDLPIGSLVPTAMAPDKESYNIDALWARIAVDLDEAKLVQLDRLRLGQRSINLRELAEQLGRAGRFVVKGIVKM